MAEYRQPGAEQRSQQQFIIFDRFKKMNNQASRVGLPDDELNWLENLQPIAPNRLQIVPAAAAAAATIPENIVLKFYAAMNNQDWLILFTTAGAGFYYNITTGITGQFAPDGTFSTAPDCTTWQASRILINDSIAGYCTWDGTLFVQSGMLSPNIEVTNSGQNYAQPPPVSILVNGSGGVAVTLLQPGSFTAPGAGTVALVIGAPPAGGVQAGGTATIVGTSPFSVASVTITNPGSGYTTPPSVTIGAVTGTAPAFNVTVAGNGATAVAVINSSGQVTGITLTNPGSGFAPTDTVTIVIGSAAGSGAAFGRTMSTASIVSIAIASSGLLPGYAVGSGYPLGIDAPGGTPAVQAVATATVTILPGNPNPVVNAVALTNAGNGYTVVPNVVWINPITGVQIAPTFVATMTRIHVASMAVQAGGTGYAPSSTLPLVFHGGGGNPQATGTATTNASGVVTGVTVTSGGSYPIANKPTVTVGAGSGATASAHVWPSVQAGTTLAVFLGRVFLAGGQLLQWSGTGATAGYNKSGYDDFLAADNSGATLITDSDLVHNITALRAFNNYLWVVGDQSIKQIGTLFPSGAPPFQLLTLSSDQGTIWPKSCISFNRIFLFANPQGIFGVFGSTVQKISDDLDGVFQQATFTQQPQGAVMDLNSKHSAVFLVTSNSPVQPPLAPPPGNRSLLLVFDGKQWWVGSQGDGLVAIASVPIFATDKNQLWGSTTGTDVTQLFADQTTAVNFNVKTAISHNNNPVQGKRMLRAGFTAEYSPVIPPGPPAPIVTPLTLLLKAENMSVTRTLNVVNDLGTVLFGGANDANNQPISASGVYLGLTLSGSLTNFTLHNLIIEYQETSLWKG